MSLTHNAFFNSIGVALFCCYGNLKRVVAQPNEAVECFEGAEFLVVAESVSFGTAKSRCLGRSATLARISNDEENSFVDELCDQVLSNGQDVWIGNFLVFITTNLRVLHRS